MAMNGAIRNGVLRNLSKRKTKSFHISSSSSKLRIYCGPSLSHSSQQFQICRFVSSMESIKVVVGGKDEMKINEYAAHSEATIDQTSAISSKIERIPPGELKEVEVREACAVINTLAHSVRIDGVSDKDRKKRGKLAWLIFRRLLIEDELFDSTRDIMLPFQGHPTIVDYGLCHNVSVNVMS